MNSARAYASIAQQLQWLRAGDCSAAELLQLYIDRIERFADNSRAFISTDFERARERAAAVVVDSDSPALLAGIPYACKDLFDVAGLVTSGGSAVLANNVAARDAVAIRRMQDAGAILLGKNNLHEFAYGATGENELFGTPRNPYDSSRLTGGSSSGSAAAVAYGLCAAALGTDTGGSVRAPAALCGLIGFKPTLGRISTDGVIPYSWSLDHVGTLCRSAADSAILFEVLADEFHPPADTRLEELVVGIPDSFFFDRCDSEILDCIESLKAFLRQSGVRFKSVTMPSMEFTRTVSLTVQMPEALSYHNRYLEQFGDRYSQDFRAGLALAQNLLAEQYVRARRFIETYRRQTSQIFAEVDLLLTPATPVIAPEIGAIEISIDGQAEPAGNAITRYTSFFNMTGHPAITLPCGVHSSGLPIGAQLVGRHHADEALLATACRIEHDWSFELPPPNLDD